MAMSLFKQRLFCLSLPLSLLLSTEWKYLHLCQVFTYRSSCFSWWHQLCLVDQMLGTPSWKQSRWCIARHKHRWSSLSFPSPCTQVLWSDCRTCCISPLRFLFVSSEDKKYFFKTSPTFISHRVKWLMTVVKIVNIFDNWVTVSIPIWNHILLMNLK